MNIDPVEETRNASFLLILGAVSPCMPYKGPLRNHENVLERRRTCLLEDETPHLSVPFAPGPNDENVTASFQV